ncbi:MAG TPA: hypothetical protein VMO26_02275 [Vicinamibacterales bacterium]|nr:hypothetical protein [Vicinamibacterales bacterium]
MSEAGTAYRRELFYLEGDKLMSASVRPATTRFEFEVPVTLFEAPVVRSGQPPTYDVAADGRLLMLQTGSAGPAPPIKAIVNWRARLTTESAVAWRPES